MPTMFKKTDFARWVCEEHPEYQVEADYINSQLVLLKYEREYARFYLWKEAEEFVLADLKKPQV